VRPTSIAPQSKPRGDADADPGPNSLRLPALLSVRERIRNCGILKTVGLTGTL
jgi:hypothetical protein